MFECALSMVWGKRVTPSLNVDDLTKGLARPKRAWRVRAGDILIQPKVFSTRRLFGEWLDVGRADWVVIHEEELLEELQEIGLQVLEPTLLGDAPLETKIAGKKRMGLLLAKARQGLGNDTLANDVHHYDLFSI